MAKRMLVDATHPEETRVVVVNGNRLEELDFEIASRKQLKGNIYLARVIRVEPSLQAAFVEYGGNRHGFLAFSEIHPDYYRIPVADREALLREQQELAEEREARAEQGEDLDDNGHVEDAPPAPPPEEIGGAAPAPIVAEELGDHAAVDRSNEVVESGDADGVAAEDEHAGGDADGETSDVGEPGSPFVHSSGRERPRRYRPQAAQAESGEDSVEEEVEERPYQPPQQQRRRPLKSYKIQEVIKRRQILLVQVTKEERGNKGAALTTYLSLPGRYAVLMPNTPRGGGISRKITNPADRKRLKEMLEDFDIPPGMSVILRTAGIERSKPEIRRDLEYLMRLWDSIRETTLQSVAPALIYEEANLIKRTIRDLYSSDIDEVHVEGEAGYRVAKDFMRMLMPSHAKKIQLYNDPSIPLYHRFQVEGAIETMFNPIVQLRSGGYIVINQTEALVAIDVNSGRSTKERNIEETAVRTNLEAAEEVARQLRLRDLAGLVVVDFIDMEDPRNNAAVEKRLKDFMKADRARIQLGRISAFGLLELSRQRLRPSLQEINFERCPHCQGTGMVRSLESAALAVLRAVEEEGIRKRSAEITVTCASHVTLYILNHKREALADIERRHGLRVYLQADDKMIGPSHHIERIRARTAADEVAAMAPVSAERVMAQTERAIEIEEAEAEAEAEAADAEAEGAEEPARPQGRPESRGDREDRDGRGRRRRRRRRRGERGDNGTAPEAGDVGDTDDDGEGDDSEEAETPAIAEAAVGDSAVVVSETPAAPAASDDDETARGKKRRRGKRGGRRRGRREDGTVNDGSDGSDETGDDGEDSGDEPAVSEAERLVEAAPVAEITPSPAAEPPAPATEEAPAAKKRVTRSRKKPVEAEAAPAEVTVEPAPVPVEETPAPAAEEAPATKKRATRSRKKVVEADAVTAEAPAAVEASPIVAAEAPATVAEVVPAAKKRATRSRKKAVEAEAAPVETVTQAVVEPVAESPTVAEAAPVLSPAAAATEVNPPVEKPKRGWWSRKS
ncbi:ribonuclease E/G [Niveispirillum lacus]|uniref:Ribonuclease E n=1 Tax=Niveispirillum lacus TaxID=1981099 RepID=A0A255YTY8_9PROT|nr:ribonuclease E/G [Niveispirillum lacus]OYQ32649.1 ribonuclease E/G [Niveispirillum lacus]